jgi:hypothetical protein
MVRAAEDPIGSTSCTGCWGGEPRLSVGLSQCMNCAGLLGLVVFGYGWQGCVAGLPAFSFVTSRLLAVVIQWNISTPVGKCMAATVDWCGYSQRNSAFYSTIDGKNCIAECMNASQALTRRPNNLCHYKYEKTEKETASKLKGLVDWVFSVAHFCITGS